MCEMRTRNCAIYLLLIVLCFACSEQKKTGNYYFDPVNGDNGNSGDSPEKPFRSLSIIQNLKLKGGDSIQLKSGASFNEQLYLSVKGDEKAPIVITKYGGNDKPIVKGDSLHAEAVYIYNSEHLVVSDLEITNSHKKSFEKTRGVFVEAHNYGAAKNIMLDNLFIHDVIGKLNNEGNGVGAAIAMFNYRDNESDSISSHFENITVQNCLIKNCNTEGITMWGNWERKRWDPSRNVVIRGNTIDGITGHGIVPVACESPLIEYNVLKNTPDLPVDVDGVDGIWPWSCDNAVVQFNVVSDIKSQWDGYAYDADYNCTNSLFQYNLSFNNRGGFLLVCNAKGWPKDWCVGNDNSVIRYNVSINDGLRTYVGKNAKKYFSPVIHCTGAITNTLIEKNLIYVLKKPEKQIDKTILHLTNWGSDNFPDSTFFKNNFIRAEEFNLAVNAENSTNHFFVNNKFVGDLKTPGVGFNEYKGEFDKSMWYDSADENWNKLVDFLKDKTIPFEGKETSVLEIIGYN